MLTGARPVEMPQNIKGGCDCINAAWEFLSLYQQAFFSTALKVLHHAKEPGVHCIDFPLAEVHCQFNFSIHSRADFLVNKCVKLALYVREPVP